VTRGSHRAISYAACAWAALFGIPHLWWALGFRAGFPGGDTSYEFFMNSWWRVLFNWTVIALSVLAIVITLVLLKPPHLVKRRWIPRTLAWIACVLLMLRGVAGIIVDGTSDLVWAPAFTIGGILLGGVAWMSSRSVQIEDI
jgi:hypothetical protein